MRRGWLLLVVAWCLGCSSARLGREREHCLFGICLGDEGAAVLARLGLGEHNPEIGHCYLVGGGTLSVTLADDEPSTPVTSLLLTQAPHCRSERELPAQRSAARTSRGVSLGDSLDVALRRHADLEPEPGAGTYPWSSAPAEVDRWDSSCADCSCTVMTTLYAEADRIIGIALWVPDC